MLGTIPAARNLLASMERDTSTGSKTTGTTDDALCERLEALEATVDSLQDTIEEQRQTIEEQQETIDEQEERIDRLEKSRGHIIEDLVELETEIEDIEPAASANSTVEARGQAAANTGNVDNFSPLGQTVSLPEHAVDSLTENQERARFIARDIQQYADMRLGELVISSGDIRKVLSAKEEKSIHWETVSRVIEFLDTMGKEDTEVKDKHGTIVCFDPESVKKWSHSPNSVVTGSKGEV